MKLTIFLICITVLGSYAADSYAQTAKLTLDVENTTIKSILSKIESQSEFKFFYSNSVDLDQTASVSQKNKKVFDILDELFEGTGIKYEVYGRQITLLNKGEAFNFPEAEISVSQQKSVSGKVTDSSGSALPGVTVVIKGTTQGIITDSNGNYSLSNIPENATLLFSFVGMKTQEIIIGGKTTINVTMDEDAIGLEEVVAVGYGTQKKINLTGAISIADKKELQNRPVANVQQALQGLVPNLQITTSAATGEPGAEMAMNIRGLSSIEGNNSPYVLVDGIPMGINDVDPSDIESISVLKDAASTSIYGARAAYGVILITTKNGKLNRGDIKVSISSNYAQGYLLNQPENAGYMEFALTANEGAINAGGAPWYSQDALDRLAKNIANPGSAPEVLPSSNGLSWQIGTDGLGCAATTDWRSLVFENSQRQKHSVSITGGNAKLNFYLSSGIYSEEGVLKQAKDHYSRYNLDAKINAEVTSWMDLSLVTKYRYGEEKYPDGGLGRSFVFMLMTRLKPTKPAFFPGTNVWTGRIGEQSKSTSAVEKQQLILSPRMVLKPLKGWVTTIELNYQTNNDIQRYTVLKTPTARPDGTGGSEIIWPSQQGTLYAPTMSSNKYMSPNIYSEYTRSFGKHNLNVLAGYQQETYKYFNILANAGYLLTDNIPSISTAVGTKTVSDNIGRWATQSLFGRLNYNFDEKYLMEFNFRYDGSSRFEQNQRWGVFPSASAGWVLSKETFFPLKDIFDFFKIRGSYGSLGNQNVANYLYIPVMPINQSKWLFNNSKLWIIGTPNLSSVDLTWEKVNTLDFGIDFQSLNRRLGTTFDWYESRTTDLVGPGEALSAILGTSPPKENSGEIRTRGWELEISWKDKIKDFSYGFKAVLSDYMSTVTKYTNPTNILTTYYNGMKLGEIWGFETEGLFQTTSEVDNWHNQQFIFA